MKRVYLHDLVQALLAHSEYLKEHYWLCLRNSECLKEHYKNTSLCRKESRPRLRING